MARNLPMAFLELLVGAIMADAGAHKVQQAFSDSSFSGGTGTGSGSSSSPGGVAPSGPGETAFFTALLKSLGAPVTQANLRSLAAWKQHESSGWPPPNKNNPLNSKQTEPGSWPTAANGISNYPTASEGIAAYVHNLPNYPCIIAHLRSGQGLCGAPCGADFLKFSGGGYSSVC
jgi:hypothetical protein